MTRTAAAVGSRHLAAGSGRTIRVMGDRVTYKAVAEETAGAYSLFEMIVEPGSSAPPHAGRYEDESLWILEGTFDLRVGDETLRLGPGAYVFVPRGTLHGLTNAGRKRGRLLLLITPGGLREKYFDEMGGARGVPEALAGPADIERAGAIAAKYGTELLFPAPDGPAPRPARPRPGKAPRAKQQREHEQ